MTKISLKKQYVRFSTLFALMVVGAVGLAVALPQGAHACGHIYLLQCKGPNGSTLFLDSGHLVFYGKSISEVAAFETKELDRVLDSTSDEVITLEHKAIREHANNEEFMLEITAPRAVIHAVRESSVEGCNHRKQKIQVPTGKCEMKWNNHHLTCDLRYVHAI